MIHAFKSIVLCLIIVGLLFVTHSLSQDTTKHKRSVAIKEPSQLFFYYLKQDYARADWDNFQLIRNANAGDPYAAHDLGLCYLTGQRFIADTAKAVYWIKKAAEQNLVAARYNLGILFHNGVGIQWNPFEAYRHFQYAAKHNMADAQYTYGLYFTDNLVVARNYSEAYTWISKSAASGYEPALDIMKEFKRLGISEQQPDTLPAETKKKKGKNTQKTTTTKQSSAKPVFIDFSADSIRPPAKETLLKEMRSEQRSRKQHRSISSNDSTLTADPDSSEIESIISEANANSPEALSLIGLWYEQGTVLPKDIVLASIYYLRATRCSSRWAPMLLWNLTRTKDYYTVLKKKIDANDPAAKFVWAELIFSGIDHQITPQQALQLLEEASKSGYIDATVELGIRLCSGSLLVQDIEHGKLFLKQAADVGNTEAQVRLWMIELNDNHANASSSLIDSLKRATDAGSVLAQAMLGYCYQKGIGVPLDLPKSVTYYREAARRGSETAYSALKEMYATLRPGDPEFKIDE